MSRDGTLPALTCSLFMGRYWRHYATHCLCAHSAVGDPVNPRAAGRDANVYAAVFAEEVNCARMRTRLTAAVSAR